MTVVQFHAAGMPKPQGSKRAFVVGNRAVMTESNKAGHKDWRATVTAEATAAMAHRSPEDGPLRLEVTFYLPRPKSHPKTRRTWPIARPDIDKLVRSIADSLTHVVWRDDSQVVELVARKTWAYDAERNDRPVGATVTVTRLST